MIVAPAMPPGVPSTIAAYGADIEKVVASVRVVVDEAKALSINDPAGTMGYIVSTATSIAAVLGVEVGSMGMGGAVIGIVGKVIDLYVARLMDGQATLEQEESKARAEAQEAVLTAMASLPQPGGPWVRAAAQKQLEGSDGYFTSYGAAYLPMVMSQERKVVFPRTLGSGCYRETVTALGSGKGKAAGDAAASWTMWVGLYPYVFNTDHLGESSSAMNLARDASSQMRDFVAAATDPIGNLLQDARVVAETLRRFRQWSRPMTHGLKGGTLVLPKGRADLQAPKNEGVLRALPHPDRGVRNLYWTDANRITLEAYDLSGEIPSDTYVVSWSRWYKSSWYPNMSCTIGAYNHVVTTLARFFAVRERMLAARWNPDVWGAELVAAAQESNDPVVRAVAALRRRAPVRVPRPTARQDTATRPGGGYKPQSAPTRVPREPPAPTRVPRRTQLGQALAAEDMRTLWRRLAEWKRRG